MAEFELISHVPATGSYKILYPNNFILNEDDDAIVTITSPETYSNLTLTGYKASLNVDEKVLCEFFDECTENFTPISNISKEITTQRFYLERSFKKNLTNWIWWALAQENQVIIISVNSEGELSTDDYHLYRYMIKEMEIYPSAFDE